MTAWVCPNGHEFQPVAVVPCAYCEAVVACVPLSAALDLHSRVERVIADDEAMRRARTAYVSGPPHGAKHTEIDRLDHMRNAIRAAFGGAAER